MELVWPRLLWFDPADAKSRQRVRTTAADSMRAQSRRLLCAACRHAVTDPNQRIAVQGAHEHNFTNPHGITFHIGCFRDASGCAAVGDATTDFSWFPGYTWRVALCMNCQAHLGWRFQMNQDYFHGLIVNRLVLENRNDNEPT